MIFQNIFDPVKRSTVYDESLTSSVAENEAPIDKNAELPPLERPEPSMFDGMGDTWKAIPNAILDTGSFLIDAARQVPLENLTTQPETREWIRQQRQEVMPENARAVRTLAKEYELDPQTAGTASQIVYGLAETLPKAILYGSVAGPSGGALLFGSEMGVNRAQSLMDEGVDEQTAINSGMLTFAANAVGLKLPAAFATSRALTSAGIGAGANVGLNVAEIQGTHWILENQDYSEVAKKYELSFADNAVAAGLGAAFGAAFWRPTVRARFVQERDNLSKRFAQELEATGRFTPEQVRVQANINATMVASAAYRWGLTPAQLAERAPHIYVADASDPNALNQIIGAEGAANLRESGASIPYLHVAQSMQTQGISPEIIRLATGWEQGADGKWRYEIPDINLKRTLSDDLFAERTKISEKYDERFDKAETDDEFMAVNDQMMAELEKLVQKRKLSDVVDAPELFRAYPQLRDFTVEFGPLPERVAGSFSPGSNRIRLSSDALLTKEKARSTLAHEIQHAIQKIEGFASGSAPKRMTRKDVLLWRDMEHIRDLRRSESWKQYHQLMKGMSDDAWDVDFAKQIEAFESNPDVAAVIRERDRLRNKWGYSETVVRAIDNDDWEPFGSFGEEINQADPSFQFREYARVAGEVEARNVERRLRMGDAERRSTTLSATEDVPRTKQIVTVGEEYAASYSPEAVANAKPLVKRIVDRVVRGESTHGQGRDSFEDYLPVTDDAADEIQKRTGHDVHGYVHTVVDSDLYHIRNRHGEGNETRDDQIALDPDEYVKVPEVVASPDNVTKGGLTKSSRLETIVYEKKYDDGVTIIVEEIRTGRRKLALRTAYKKIPSTPDVPEDSGPRALRPERSEAASSLEKSIPQTSANVNDSELLQIAWHGTPYQFDRFSTEHIGTGTGRSTHGWGLYFTDDREVAEKYRNMTGPDGRVYKVDVPEDQNLLDADATYDEQPDKVREAIDRLYRDEYHTAPPPDFWTGREVYQDIILHEEGYTSPDSLPDDYLLDMELEELAGDSRLASKKLNSIDVKGVKFLGDDDDTGFVVFDDAAIQIIESFENHARKASTGTDGELLQILDSGSVLGSYSPSENRITLTPNANISTFSHEMGHWYLDNLFRASGMNGAAKVAQDDTKVLLSAFGINSLDDWNALGIEGQRKFHERFAAWVEKYLSEGKSPSPSLNEFFRRFGEWIKEVYEHFANVDDALSGRHQDEFGEALPQLSPEVRKVLDRMYTDEFGSSRQRPTKVQIAAARVIQVQEKNTEKKLQPTASKGDDAYTAATNAQRKAVDDLNNARPVDVSREMKNTPADRVFVDSAQKTFARQLMTGTGETAVVLQNRDRSTVASTGQINAIAANPIYELLSFSRSSSTGAPIVAFGEIPDDAHLGVRDVVNDATGAPVPVVYAVMEASDIQTSNNFAGAQNERYGDPQFVNAVAGNGRLIGLTEAYRRGTGAAYKERLMADGMHGIAPSVIAGMQQPVLVRIMPPEKVTTGFVSRSNFDQVLQRSKAEVAAEDAPKIRANLSQYRFDENGNPTKETTRQFIIDVGEPNALGSLITADGEPTLDAVERIKIAAFHEAYQSPALTEYFAAEVNPNIRKILNAMAMFAPRLIQIREATAGAIDLGPALVYAANAVHNQRIKKLPLEDLIGIQDKLATPAAGPVTDFLVRNVNSAAAINRVLNDLADWVVATTQTTSTDDIFGGSLAVRADLSDALAQLRRLENRVLAEKGQLALPDIDVADLRSRVAEFVEQQAREAQVAADKQRAMSSQQEIADVPPAEIESAKQTAQTQVLEGVSNDPDAIRLQEITASNPEQTFMFEDDDDVVRELRLDEVDAEVQRIEAEGETEASGLAQAAICIIRNEGI